MATFLTKIDEYLRQVMQYEEPHGFVDKKLKEPNDIISSNSKVITYTKACCEISKHEC